MTDADLKELIKTAKAAELDKNARVPRHRIEPAVVIELATRLRVLERLVKTTYSPSISRQLIDRAAAELEAEDNDS